MDRQMDSRVDGGWVDGWVGMCVGVGVGVGARLQDSQGQLHSQTGGKVCLINLQAHNMLSTYHPVLIW